MNKTRNASTKKPLKLKYYNVAGSAEPIRILLSYLDLEFDEEHMKKSDYKKLCEKNSVVLLPLLEIMENESKSKVAPVILEDCDAIMSFFGLKYNLLPRELSMDYYNYRRLVNLNDEITRHRLELLVCEQNEKNANFMYAKEEIIPRILKELRGIYDDYKSAYFLGESISLADIYFINIIDKIQMYDNIDIKTDYYDLYELKMRVIEQSQKLNHFFTNIRKDYEEKI